jgi:hypothetical protein
MSVSAFLGGLLNTIFSGATEAAKAAKDVGASSVKVAGQTISLPALISQLGALAKNDPGGALITSLHYTNLKDFLLSQQFESDLVDVADLLGLIGLVVPPVAVAANDLREFATILTVVHALVSGAISLGLFNDLIPDGRGGFVSKSWAADPRHQLKPNGDFAN